MTRHSIAKRQTVTIRLKPDVLRRLESLARKLKPQPSRAALIESLLEEALKAAGA